MDLLKRLANLFRSNVNAALDAAEDPIKMTDQVILDMQEREKSAKRKLVELLALEKAAEASSEGGKGQEVKDIREQREKLQQFMLQVPDFIKKAKKARDELYAKQIRAQYQSRKKDSAEKTVEDSLQDTRSFETFDRMAEKVDGLEAESQALIELSGMDDKIR